LIDVDGWMDGWIGIEREREILTDGLMDALIHIDLDGSMDGSIDR
jgi:hypothetical protein